MGLMESLRSFYNNLEEQYYSFLDKVESAGIPVYKLVDVVEDNNVPSFPIFLIVFLVLVGLVFYSLNSLFFGGSSLSVFVQDPDGNPIEFASVFVSGKDFNDVGETDEDGKVVFSVPKSGELELRVEKTGFRVFEDKFKVDAGEIKKIVELSRENIVVSKTISFLESDSRRLVDSDLRVELSCTDTDFSRLETVSGGEISVEVTEDCGGLRVKPLGNFEVENDLLLFSSKEPLEVFVKNPSSEFGSVVVSVVSDSGEVVAGVDVRLFSVAEDGSPGTMFELKQTSASGSVTFASVPSGKYYVVVYDKSGEFAEYDGLASGLVKEVRVSEVTSFSVVLSESVVGKIRLRVVDKVTGDAIGSAKVSLFKGDSLVSSLLSNDDGFVEFSVGEDIEYRVLVDKQGYLILNENVVPSPDTRVLELEAATVENSQGVLVRVVDEFNVPIENVRVRLKRNSDGAQVGGELVTGLDGRVLFERIEEGAYYVYAVKPGYGEKTSETFSVSSRQENVVSVKIPIGSGRVEVEVVDEANKPVAGASVRIVDFGAMSVVKDEISDSDGKKVVTLRADKKVFFIVSADGFTRTVSAPVQLQKDVTVSKRVVLYRDSQRFLVEFEGVRFGEEEVLSSDESALVPGQEYTGVVKLFVPSKGSYDEAGVHVRVGKEKNNVIDKDIVYITDVRGAFNSITKGSSFNPPLGQGTDFSNLTSGNAKWANVVFENVGGGVYEVEVDFMVRSEAKIGDLVEFWYRGYLKSGGYLRDPNDAVLGSSSSNNEKQGLYANAKKRVFSVGTASALCGEDFCASFSIEDLSTNISSFVFENYDAQVLSKYKLVFDVTSKSESPFSVSELFVRDRSGSVLFDSYKVVTARGEQRQGVAGDSEVSVSVGDIGKDSVVSGEIVFEAKKEGTIPIEVSIVSGSSSVSEVYKKVIYVKALPAKKLVVDVVPKVVVPLINNNLLVRVSDEDGSVVSNAVVSLKKNGEVIASGETDFDGVFAYTLFSPEEGAVIGFSVEKPGFAPVERELKVTSNVLLSDPKIVKLNVKLGSKEFTTLDVVLLNYSQIPLSVDEVSLSSDFDGFVGLNLSDFVEGTVMAPDSNLSISGRVLLLGKALTITKPLRILGSLRVKASNPNFGQQWLVSVPVEIVIGFGGEVDDVDCFSVLPESWDVVGGSTSEVHKAVLTFVNNCTVNGAPVDVRDVSMRVVSSSGKLPGEFRVVSSSGKSVKLDGSFRKIGDLVGKEDELLSIEFKPNDVISVSSNVKVEVMGKHYTSSGAQELVDKIDVLININNLNACVEVLTNNDITVESCPYNVGFGGFSGYFSQYSGSRYAAYDPYAVRNGYGTGIPPYVGTDYVSKNPLGASYYDYGNPGYMNSYFNSYYPNSSYSSPFYLGSSFGTVGSFGGMWRCGSGQFQIRNSCESSVEVSFDPQPGISVLQSTITLKPGETSSVVVEPTNFFGRYALGVKAKSAGSSQKTVDLKRIFVNVTNELFKNYRDCISVSPSRTLSFNNFVGKPVLLQVINSCFDQGVFLEASNNAISFTGENVSTPTDSASGFREMIESHAFLGEEIKPQASGRVSQILTFEVVKAIKEYRNKAPDAKFFEKNQFANIGNLRYFLTAGYYAVQGRANLIVNFFTPYGTKKSVFFPMIIQDYWNALEFADKLAQEFTTYGNPKLQAGQCINDDAFNFSKLGDLPVSTYYTSENGNLFKIDEANGCGNVDKIVKPFNPSVFVDEKTGLKMIIEHDGHEATISFDTSNWNGEKTVFRESTISTVSRVSPPRSQIHRFNISFNVKADPSYANRSGVEGDRGGKNGKGEGGSGGKNEDSSEFSFVCGVGESGTGVFRKLGLQHLSFDWRVAKSSDGKGIKIDSCDVLEHSGEFKSLNVDDEFAPLFCDAVQSSIALSQKLGEVKSVVDSVKATSNGVGACVSASGFECGKESNKNSVELFRYVVAQSSVGAYFLSNGRLASLRDEAFEKRVISGLESSFEGVVVSPENDGKVRSDVGKVIERASKELEKSDYKGADLVLEVYGWSDEGINEGVKSPVDIGAVQIDAGKGWFVLGFNDYKELRQGLLDCLSKDPNAKTCVVGNGKVVSVEFLRELINKGSWKLVAKNSKGLSEHVKELVMRFGEWSVGKDKVVGKYANLFEFYSANINPRMFLISDDYDDGFVEAFKASSDYSGLLSGFDLSFSGVVNSTGDYGVLVNYNWVSGKVVVSFEEKRNLQQIDKDNALSGFNSVYSSNPLFYLPIDGSLSVGVGFEGQDRSLFFFNDYDVTDPVLNPTANKSGVVNNKFVYKSDYADTKGGRVLVVSKDSLEFSPSDPIKLRAVVSKALAKQPAGLLFEFRSNSKGVSLKQSLDAKWMVSVSGVSEFDAGQVVETKPYRYGDLCSEGNLDASYDGLVVSNDGSGTVVFDSLVFVPTNTPKVGKSYLRVVCSRDSGSLIEGEDVLSGKKLGDTSVAKELVLSRVGDSFVRTDYNLKDLLALVKGSDASEAKACVKVGDGVLELFWNDAGFLG